MASARVLLRVVAVAVASWLAYQLMPPPVADVVIWPYAACLVLGAALVYPAVRRHGTSAGAAASAALVVPALWLAKELHRVSAVYPPAQTAYYALNPLSLGVFCAAGVEMALAELLVGPRGRRALAGWPGAVLAGVALLAIAAAWVGHDSGGRDIFYDYVALYRKLFSG